MRRRTAARALSVVAESSTRLGRHDDAIAALARIRGSQDAGAILRAQSRATDLLIRPGGDELLILPEGGQDAAGTVAQRVHQALSEAHWSTIAGRDRIVITR